MYRNCTDHSHLRHDTSRALYKDTCLFVVPESHKHPRTPEQRSHSSTLEPPTDPFDMPSATRVTLQGNIMNHSTANVDNRADLNFQFFIQPEKPSSTTPTSCTALYTTQRYLEQRCMHVWEIPAADPVVL